MNPRRLRPTLLLSLLCLLPACKSPSPTPTVKVASVQSDARIMPSFLVVPPDTNIYTFTLGPIKFDPANNYNVTNNQVSVRSNSGPFYSVFDIGPTNVFYVPHLVYGTDYWICVKAQGLGMSTSNSVEFHWPQPLEVYVNRAEQWAGVSGLSITLTNPPGNQFWRVKSDGTNKVQEATASLPGSWVELPFTRGASGKQPVSLVISESDNQTPFERPEQ